MEFQQMRLPNGMKVLTIPMKASKSVSVAVWVRTGGRYEPRKLSGVSHFLEHMLFKGTRSRSTRQIKQEIEGVGGLLNAFTGEECTCYFAKLLKNHYPKALDVLSDMVNHATLTPQELEKERTVIIEEIRMYRDLPAHYVQELIQELMWPDEALGRPIAGTEETVSRISRSGMADYKARYYHPRNILVSVSGSVEHQEVLDLATRHFPHESKYPQSKFTASLKRQMKPRHHFFEKETEQTHFVIGLPGLSRYDPDRYKLALLNIILGGNMSSRLFDEVREKRGLAYEIKSGCSFYEDTGSLLISAGVENKKTPLAISVILRELGKLTRRPVQAGELRRAKDYFTSQLYMALEDTLDHLLWLGERAVHSDELLTSETVCREIEAVTAGQILELSRRLFVTAHLNLALIGPIQAAAQKKIIESFEIANA